MEGGQGGGGADVAMRLSAPQSAEMVAQLTVEFQQAARPQRIILEHDQTQGQRQGHHLQSDAPDQRSQALHAPASPRGVGLGASAESLLYLIPPAVCATSVDADFVALSVSPPPPDDATGGLRTADYHLEPLLLPTTNVDYTAHVLSTFEAKVSSLPAVLVHAFGAFF